jgi:hypothetical protein
MKRYVFILTIVLMSGTICTAQVYYLSLNKDVRNETGMDAHGLKIVVSGQPEVLQNFDGVTNENHFGRFTTEVIDGTTVLWWSEPLDPNGQARPIPDGEWVHIGYRLNLPAEILEAYWTDENGDRIGDIGQPSQEVTRLPDGSFDLTITNDLRNGISVSFEVTGYASVGHEIPLAQLNASNPLFNNLTPLGGAGGNTQLSSGLSESLTIPGDPDKPYTIYVKEGKNGNNEVTFRDYGYYGPSELDPQVPRVPTVSEWGLIIMGLLLLVAGTVMIVRRKQRITA